MKTTIKIGIAVVTLGLASAVSAADPAAGKAKTDSCTGCHGMNGKSTNPNYPNLAGQKEAYLAKALKAYRDGGRKDPMMSTLVSGLTDADIENIAAYYASVK